MRTDPRSDLLLAVNDDSTPAEKALFHAVLALEAIAAGRVFATSPKHIEGVLAQVDKCLSPQSEGTEQR